MFSMPTLVGVEVGAMKLMISHLQTKTKGGIEVMLTEKHLLRPSKFELPNYVLTFVHTRYFATLLLHFDCCKVVFFASKSL